MTLSHRGSNIEGEANKFSLNYRVFRKRHIVEVAVHVLVHHTEVQ